MASLIKSGSDRVKSLWDDFFPMEKFFDRSFPNWKSTLSVPAVNVRESASDFTVELAAPGKSREDFVVKVENGNLTISSEQKEEHVEEEDQYTRREYNYSSFSRTFTLPQNVDEAGIKANYKDGVLFIVLPKTNPGPEDSGRTIEIS